MTRSSARDLDSAVIVTVPAAASRAVWTPSIGESYYLHVPKTEKGEDFLHSEGFASMGVEILDRAPVNGE
jgi:hypothetical protein